MALQLALDPEHRRALGAGLCFGLLALAAAAWLSTLRRRPLANGGALMAAASVAAGAWAVGATAWSIVGVGWCGLAGLWADRRGASLTARITAAAPAAAVLTAASDATEPAALLVGLGAGFAGPMAADFQLRRPRSAMGCWLLVPAVLGVYAAVPDTEAPLAVAGAVLVVALAAWPFSFVTMGGAGAQLMVHVLFGAVLRSGQGRPASVIGAMLCLGVLVVEPLAIRLAHRSDGGWWELSARLPPAPAGIAAAQLGLVLVASRVVGMLHQLELAVLLGAVFLALSTRVVSHARPVIGRLPSP